MDAEFLATGENQHVFIGQGQAEGTWVYKIPASFGYTLPFDHQFHVFRPKNSRERVLRLVLVNLPRRLYRNTYVRLSTLSEMHRLGQFDSMLKPLEKVFQTPGHIGGKLLAAYCKQARLKNFERMLDILDFLIRQNLSDIPLPYRIIREGEITLRVNGVTVHYKGPILRQKRADYFFEKSVNLNMFNWGELVTAQHRLWKKGVGFSAQGEILGPKNWALLDGRLHLADTGALTRHYHEAYSCLSEEKLDKRQENVLRHLKQIQSTDPSQEYFRFIRQEINRDKLSRLWGADLKNPAAGRPKHTAATSPDV